MHIVAHSESNTNICGGGIANNACGIHFFSAKETGPWRYSLDPVYTNYTELANGSKVQMFMRQRPQIVFDLDGVTPRYMANGGSFNSYIHTGSPIDIATESTYIFEFNTQ